MVDETEIALIVENKFEEIERYGNNGIRYPLLSKLIESV